jgi:ficolin
MKTDGGGWTVIQRRGDYPEQESFYRTWADYKEGFGSLKRDFWLGNDKISLLTNQDVYNLRFDLGDFDGKKLFAEYSGFRVADESDKYRMTFDSFLKGDATDSFTMHKNAQFSTKDQNNEKIEKVNCAQACKGGWWYKGGTARVICYESNLNGLYLRGDHPEMNLRLNHDTD